MTDKSMTGDTPGVSEALLKDARSIIAAGEACCVLIKDDSITDIETGRGIAPLMKLYTEKPDRMEGSFVVDKVIGKAAAMLCVCARVKGVHAELMSLPAAEYLRLKKIPVSRTELSTNIKNRQGTGICPMEASVLGEDDPERGLVKIRAAIEMLKTGAQKQS